MEQIKKFFTVLQLLIGLDWSVIHELEEIEKRLYAVEQESKLNRASNRNLNLAISKLAKERGIYDD